MARLLCVSLMSKVFFYLYCQRVASFFIVFFLYQRESVLTEAKREVSFGLKGIKQEIVKWWSHSFSLHRVRSSLALNLNARNKWTVIVFMFHIFTVCSLLMGGSEAKTLSAKVSRYELLSSIQYLRSQVEFLCCLKMLRKYWQNG